MWQHSLPGSPVIAARCAEADRPTADFTAPTAPWRQHAPTDVTIREGADIARSVLVTVVIGFRNQPGLSDAVRSLLAQDQSTGIVVVNTGGGDVARTLAPVLGRIRLICCAIPCKVGAARNIGPAASRAPFIAFLAGDCLARPRWVSGRLALHRARALLRQEPGLTGRMRSALLATGWVAWMANLRGTLEGLARIAAADALIAPAEAPAGGSARKPAGGTAQALALANAAWRADPADPGKACLLGALCHASGNAAGAMEAWRAALGP